MAQPSKQMKTSKAKKIQNEPMNSLEAEIAVTALHTTGAFKVLRKLNLEKEPRFTLKPIQGSKTGICLDTETTGLNHLEDKIIELGIVAFEYDPITAEIIRISTRVLEYLLFKFGLFISAHRALDDAEGVLGILLGKLPVSKTSVFKSLLNTHDEVTSKISAVGASFDKKDILKQRGYRWNDGSQGGCKAWWISVPSVFENDELVWLAGEVYPDGSTDRVEISRINAVDRFSVREQ